MKIRPNQLLKHSNQSFKKIKNGILQYMASSEKKFFCTVGYNREEIFHILNLKNHVKKIVYKLFLSVTQGPIWNSLMRKNVGQKTRSIFHLNIK
jgi:hypothetical protein